MRIVALSLLVPVDSHPCRLSEQSGKSEEVAGPIQRRIPGLCQGMRRSRDRRGRKNADRREADQGTDGGSRSQEKRTRRTVQATGRPSCAAPERDSRCTAVKPYRCKASRNQRRRRDETNEETNPYRARRWVCGGDCNRSRMHNSVPASSSILRRRATPLRRSNTKRQSIANEVQQIEQGQQIFTNTVKIATTALQAYNVAKQQYELTHQMILAPTDALCAISVSNF